MQYYVAISIGKACRVALSIAKKRSRDCVTLGYRSHQHPPGDAVPKTLPALVAPALDAIDGEQKAVEGTPACDAVVAAPCVAVLGASPGNCLAVCGLTDAGVLMPPVDPVVAPPKEITGGLTRFLVGTLNGSEANGLEAQPAAGNPPIDVPCIEHAPVRFGAPGLVGVGPVGAEAEGTAVADVGPT